MNIKLHVFDERVYDVTTRWSAVMSIIFASLRRQRSGQARCTSHLIQSSCLRRQATADYEVPEEQRSEDLFPTRTVPQTAIDQTLYTAGNSRGSAERIAVFYTRQRPEKDCVAFLRREFGTENGRGIEYEGKKYAVWFMEDGIHLAQGDSVRTGHCRTTVTWEQASARILELLEAGTYLSAAELAQAQDKVLFEMGDALLMTARDLTEEGRAQGLFTQTLAIHDQRKDYPELDEDMGEILGLTWENVHISDEDIAADNAYVYIDKELTRASKRAIETLGEKDIYYIFTPLMPNTSTRIILKKPKTDSSIRKVWLPKTLAYILREWKKSQDELKGFLGNEYQDFDLVVALPNGRPCEDRIILKEFAKLREDAGLPKVVFHSLRHSSTTYKLKLNHGDLKATQGDTGHAEIDMITSIYAHILDEDRKVNAQKFETAFYAKPDLRNVRPPEEPAKSEPATLDLESLVEQLQKSPELASALAALIAAQAPAK